MSDMEVVKMPVKCVHCQRNTSTCYETFAMDDGSTTYLHKVCYPKFVKQLLQTATELVLPPSGLTHAVILKDINAGMVREDLGVKPRFVGTRSVKRMFTIQCGKLQQQILTFVAVLFFVKAGWNYQWESRLNEEEEFIEKVNKKCDELFIHIAKQMYI